MSYDAWKADWPGYADASEERDDDDVPPVYWLVIAYNRGLDITSARLRVRRPDAWHTLSEAVVAGNDPAGALQQLRAHRRAIRGAR